MTGAETVIAATPAGLLLERERHADAVRAALGEAAEGAGSTVVVVGEAGVGKSRLLAELATLGPTRFRVLRARGDEFEQEFAYGVVRQLLEPALRAAADAGDPWSDAAELARPIFVAAGVGAEGTSGDASFAHQQGLYWLVSNLADLLGPLVLVVDDAHRADELSLRFVRFLAHRLDGLPVAQILASRPAGEVERRAALTDMLDDPMGLQLPVERLSEAATAEYLRSAWDAAAEPLGPVCHELTAGNPLMLRALRAEVQRAGLDPASTTTGELRVIGARPLGQRIRRALAAAPPSALPLAEALSVLGQDVAVGEAVALAGLDEAEAAAGLESLLRLNVVEEGPAGLRFVHPLVRTSVYRELSPVERAAAHLNAARRLHERGVSGEAVAAHLLHAGPTGQPWAGRELDTAADRALELGAPDTAARLLVRALEESADNEAQRAARLAKLAGAESQAGLPGALEHYEDAVALANGGESRLGVVLAYSGALAMAGRTDRSFEVLDGVLAALPGENPPALEAMLHASALFSGAASARSRRDAIAERIAPPRPSEAQAGEDPAWRLLAGTHAFELALRGRPADEVASLIVPAVSGEGLPLALDTTSAWGFGIWALLLAERFDSAAGELERALARGHKAGAVVLVGLALCLRSGLQLRRGELLLAEADAQESLALTRYPSWRFGAAASRQFLVDALLEQGRVEDAGEALERLATDDVALPAAVSVDVLVSSARTRFLLATRRHEAALVEALDLGRRAVAARLDNVSFVPWRRDAAFAARAVGDGGQASALAAEHLAAARAFRAPAALADALVAAATVGAVDGPEALAEAVELATPEHAPLARSRALLALGRTRRVGGAPGDSRPLLREAMELASASGAVPLVDATVDELAASGARPRKRGGHGADTLTAAEQRVARLAAEGASNREIAQTLFVTQKTVEMHLSSAYRKLSITSRAQLGAKLEQT